MQADILQELQIDTCVQGSHASCQWDIIISNPPYISPESFKSTTTRSVRKYEPRVALVPPKATGIDEYDHGDTFYPRIIDIAAASKAKILLVEVGDRAQAERVALMCMERNIWSRVEIWKDDPRRKIGDTYFIEQGLQGIDVVGQGEGRSVFCWSDSSPRSE